MITKFDLSNKFKSWARVITMVDTTKTNGYAFIGGFIPINQLVELKENDFVLTYDETGSQRNRNYKACLYKIENEEVRLIFEEYGRDWVLKLRDKSAELINKEKTKKNPLEKYSTEILIQELKSRGIESI